MSVAAALLPTFVLVAILLVLLLPVRQAAPAPDGLEGRALGLVLLFFTLTALALITRKADLAFVILAWIFVAARLLALFPALAGAAARGGRPADLVSALVLALMWVLFALAILLGV